MSTEQEHVATQLRDPDADTEQVAELDQHVRALTASLTALGLTVRGRGRCLVVRNPAVSQVSDPQGYALNPGLSQRILLQRTDHGWYWCWLWDAPRDTRTPAPGDIEPICPIHAVDDAAKRISNVLSLLPAEGVQW